MKSRDVLTIYHLFFGLSLLIELNTLQRYLNVKLETTHKINERNTHSDHKY